MDVLAGDVEPEDRDRQVPAALVEARQLVAADDLAATDAVDVAEHDVEGVDVGIGVEKGARLLDGSRTERLCRQSMLAGLSMIPKS